MSDQAGAEVRAMTADEKDCETEKLRIRKAFWLCIVGLAYIFVLIIVLVCKEKGADEIVSIVGILTGVLGTLVGAFFGLQIGADGKEKVDKRAKEAQHNFEVLMFHATDEWKSKLPDEIRNKFLK